MSVYLITNDKRGQNLHDAMEAASGSSSSTVASYASSSTFTDTPSVGYEAEESEFESSLAAPLSKRPHAININKIPYISACNTDKLTKILKIRLLSTEA